MDMFRRFFFVVVLAGATAGLVNAAVQQWRVVPFILEAELYEGDEHAHESEQIEAEAHGHDATDIATSAAETTQEWAPQEGFERTFFTILATLLAGIGFSFLLAAISIFTKIEVTIQNGLYWGLGGFLAFSMMPAIGLAPELPGMVGAELGARQFWWWFTALATLCAILVVVKVPNYIGFAIALALIILPHYVGAPVAPDVVSLVPAHLASSFAANALFASLLFWLTLGFVFGRFNGNKT